MGCLGTDGIGRDIKSLVAKIKGLREQGISAYAYTGSYQVPVRTLTGGIIDDIMTTVVIPYLVSPDKVASGVLLAKPPSPPPPRT